MIGTSGTRIAATLQRLGRRQARSQYLIRSRPRIQHLQNPGERSATKPGAYYGNVRIYLTARSPGAQVWRL